MTEYQQQIVKKLIEFVAADPGNHEENRAITRRECMTLLGLIDRLTVKAEGGRPPARLGGVRLAGETKPGEPIMMSNVQDPASFEPTVPMGFDGTYPPANPEKRAGAKEPPPAGSGGAP